MSISRTMQLRAALVTTVLLVVLPACSPDLVFYADPYTERVIELDSSFQRDVRALSRESGVSIVIESVDSDDISSLVIAEARSTAPGSVLVSGLLIDVAEELSASLPEIEVGVVGSTRGEVATGEGAEAADNAAISSMVIHVVFDRLPAFREAGELLRELEDRGRNVILLFRSGGESRAAEREALEDGFGRPVDERIGQSATREAIRERLLQVPDSARVIFGLFLGDLNAFALAQITEAGGIVSADLYDSGAYRELLLASVERPLVHAIRDFVYRSGEEAEIVVPAVLRRTGLEIRSDSTDN